MRTVLEGKGWDEMSKAFDKLAEKDPAFPIVALVRSKIGEVEHDNPLIIGGLTKHELFTAMAMQGLLANPMIPEMLAHTKPKGGPVKWYTERALDHADDLLDTLDKLNAAAKEPDCGPTKAD